MRSAKYSKVFILSVCLLLVFAVTAALLFGSGASLSEKDNIIADTGEGADEVSGALVSNTGYTHGSNVKNNTTAEQVGNASALVSAIQNNKTFRLTNNITLTSDQVKSIWNTTFSGTIYGNGYTITASFPSTGNAASVTNSNHKAAYGGLCGKLTGAIYDLTFNHTGGQLNVRITGNNSGFAGGLIGSIEGGTVENVKVVLSNSNGGRVGLVKESSGSGWGSTNYYVSAGALAGRIYSGTVRNVTIINDAWIESGITSGSGSTSVSSKVPGHVGNVAGIIGPVQGESWSGSIKMDNIIIEGSVSSASLVGQYTANIGTLTTSTTIELTNFYNKFKNTYASENNGSSASFAVNGCSPTLTISNQYQQSGVTTVNSTADDRVSISSTVTVGNDYTVYFDPSASNISNSLAVVKTGVSGGDTKKAVLTTNSGAKYGDYAFADGGSTVIMRNLPTAISNWSNGGNFKCSIEIMDRYVSNPTISGSYAYTGSPIDVSVSMTYNGSAFTNYTLTYEASGNGAQLSNGKPLTPGSYIVRVKLNGEDPFSDGTKEYQLGLTVDKKTIQNPNLYLADPVYNGQEKEATFESSNSGAEAVRISYSGDRKNAGTFTATITPTDYYKFADNAESKQFELTIQKKDVTLKANDINNEFANESPAYGYTITAGEFYEDIIVNYACSVERLSNAGETFEIVPTVAEFAEIGNYNITYQNGTLTIVPKTVEITAKYPEGNTIEYSGVVTNSQIEEMLFNRPLDINGEKLLLAFEITKDGAPATVQYVGTYTIKATIAESYNDDELGTVYQTNYTAAECVSTITVTSRKITVTLKDSADPTKVYDGIAVTDEELKALFDVKNTIEQGSYPDLVVTVTEGEIKNAGEYNVSVDLTSDDKLIYELSEDSVSTLIYTVEKIEVDGAVTAPLSTEYDGQAKEATFSFTGESPMIGADEISLTYKTDGGQTTANVVSAGTYTATASLPEFAEGKSNYKWAATATQEVSFTVTPKEISVVWGEKTFVYDGTAKVPSASASGVGEESVNIVVAVKDAEGGVVEGGAVNAGSYTAEATTDNGNYTLKDNTTAFEITRADIDLSVSIADWTYGEEAAIPVVEGNAGVAEVTYLYEGVEGTEYSSDVAPTKAGRYTVTVTVGESANYNGGSATSEAFSVNKAVLIDETQDVVATYNAAEHGISIVLSGFVNGEDMISAGGVVKYSADGVEYDLDSYMVKNATQGAVVVYYQITFENYETVTDSANVTVNAKQVAVVWNDMTQTYTGASLKPTASVSAADLEGEDTLEITVKTTKDGEDCEAVNVGVYGAVASADNTNYILTDATVDNFTVVAADFDSSVVISDWAYKEEASSPSVSANPGEGNVSYTYKGRGETVYEESSEVPTQAGTYTVTATIAANGNYAKKVVSADFTIEKATVQLPVVEDKQYTGSVITSGLVDNEYYTVFDEGGTEVRPYTAVLTLRDSANYKWSAGDEDGDGVAEVHYEIVAQDVELNAWNTEPSIRGWTYGAYDVELNKPVFEAKFGNSTAKFEFRLKTATDENYATVEDLSKLDAGIYLMRVTIDAYKAPDGGESYTGLSKVVEFTVAKASLTVSISIDRWTYGEEAKAPVISGNEGGKVTYSYEGTGDTSYEASTTAPKNAGTYKVTATVAETTNYLGATAEAEFTIAKKAITATVSAEKATYDGIEHAATVSFDGKVGEDELTVNLLYNGEAVVPVDAGRYTVTVQSYGGSAVDNYDITTAEREVVLKISPKELNYGDFDVKYEDVNFDGVYDGKPHGAVATIKDGVLIGDDTLTITVLYDGSEEKPVNAGEYKISLKISGNDNYVMGENNSAEFVIKKATVKVNGANATAVYTGEAFTEEQIISAVFKDADLSLVNVEVTFGNGVNVVNAGETATVTLTLKDKENYEFASDAKTSYVFTVTPAEISISGENVTAQYRGEAYGDEEIKNAIFGENNWSAFNIEIYYNNAYALNAGDVATVTVTGCVDGNYTLAPDAVKEYTFTVTTAKVEAPELVQDSYEYNGEEIIVSLKDPANVGITGNVKTDAGNYTATVALADKTNYEWVSGGSEDVQLSWSITAKNVTLKAETSVEKVYDGKGYDFSGYTVSGIEGFYERDKVTVSVSAGDIFTPGSYGIAVSHNAGGNYYVTVESTEAQLTIGKAKLVITVKNAEIEYNGKAIEFEFSIEGVVGEDEVSIGKVVYKRNGIEVTPMEIGAYVAEFTLAGAQADYYTADTVNVSVTAPTTEAPEGMKAENIITPEGEIVYDGKEHNATLNYDKAEGDLNTYGLIYYLDGNPVESVVNAGVYTVRVYKNSSIYLIEGIEKQIVVLPEEITVDEITVYEITTEGLIFTYSGGKNTVTATAKGVNGENVTLVVMYDGEETAPVNAGKYTVTFRSDNGNYVVAEGVSFEMTVKRKPINKPVAPQLTYNGKELTAFADTEEYTVSGTFKATDVSAKNYTAVFTLISENYKWSNEADELRKISVSWNITPAEVVIGESGAEKSKTYDGNALTDDELKALFTAPDKIGGGKVEINVAVNGGVEVRDAGEYTITATVNDINYASAEISVTYTVTKADPTVSAVVQDKLMQEGDKLSTVGISLGEDSTAGEIVWDEPDRLLEKGENVVTWSFIPADGNNYNGASGSVTLTVGDEKLTAFEIVEEESSYKTEYVAFEDFDGTGIVLKATFDGMYEQKVTLAECEIEIENATADGKMSGATTVVTIRYGNLSVQINVTVEKIKVSVPVPEKSEFEYNAEAQTVVFPESELYNVVGGDTQTNVGKHNAEIALADTVNYVWEDGTAEDKTVKWEITPVTLSGEITLPENVVYDGNAKTATFTLTQGTLYGGAKMTITYELTDGTVLAGAPVDAGVYEVVATLPDSNYQFAEGTEYSKAMTIEKKTVEIVTIGSREKVYDGKEVTAAQLAEHFSVSGGITVKVTVSGTVLNAGTYSITAEIDEKNYRAEPVTCTYTVRKAERSISASLSVGYRQVEIAVDGANEGVEYSLDGNVWQTLNGAIAVELQAKYAYYVRYAESANYNASPAVKVEANITKAALATYADERFGDKITLKDAADIAWFETLASAADGENAEFDERMAQLSAERERLVNGATAAVEKALKAGGALRGYAGAVATVALTLGGVSVAAALGLCIKNRKGGKKNEEK